MPSSGILSVAARGREGRCVTGIHAPITERYDDDAVAPVVILCGRSFDEYRRMYLRVAPIPS